MCIHKGVRYFQDDFVADVLGFALKKVIQSKLFIFNLNRA